MFDKARFRLTILYSLIFLLLFWVLSAGAYEWMNSHFGDGQRRDYDQYALLEQPVLGTHPNQDSPSDRVMDELRNTLIGLDILLLILVPTFTWFLTGKTLAPVQEAHEREKRFFTDASHDLRTPLTILKGEVELALKHNRPGEVYRKTLRSSQEEIDTLIDLVENMLFFAREDRQHHIWSLSPVDLTDVLAERAAVFQRAAQAKHITLTFTPPDEPTTILANRQLLQRLFSSLLDNAVKYTPPSGKITVTLSTKPHVMVVITDTGIGIPPEDQQRIFDRFYRSEASRMTKGYGLGLSIATKIMAYHHGKISLASTVGQGTTFTLHFPRLRQSPGKSLS